MAPGGQSADVSVVHKVSGKEVTRREDHKTRALPLEEGPHATVGINGKVTFQPAPYESITVGVSLYMPCAPTFEAADQMYARVSNWVDQRLQHEVAVARGEAEPVPLELPEQ